MHSSLMVSHIQKLAHVVRTSNAVSSNKYGGTTYLVATFMEYDSRLTVGTLT